MNYYISPRFLNKLSVHITKNYLDLPQVKLPLILGIHGRKGEGKTFQCELVFKEMGVEVVYISGGELESPDAGDPARLVRMRYREAAELVRVRGRMAVLMINDLDAGAGRFDRMTQYTVNTQLVNNTLMNIADNPTNVQLPGSYDEKPLPRIPIIATGNDFATLYAPLIRDGRMQKFYWAPSYEERIGIVTGMYAQDGLSAEDITQFVDRFKEQAIDFFGAVRSQVYDEQITQFIASVGIENVAAKVVNAISPPTFGAPNFQLAHLIEVGDRLLYEQAQVRKMSLVDEYNQALTPQRQHAQYHRDPALLTPPETNRLSPYAVGSQKHSAQSSQSSQGSLHQQSSSPWQRLRDAKVEQLKQINRQARDRQPGTSKTGSHKNSPHSSDALSTLMRQQLSSIVATKQRLGIEHVDQRRFRNNSWQSFTTISSPQKTEATRQLLDCLTQFPDHYIRLIGIDPQSRRRMSETIVHRPH